MNISEIRRENARYLANSIGGISKMADKMNRAHQQISLLIGKNPKKNIGHSLAKQIEFAFGKEKGWMDHEHPDLWSGEGLVLPNENVTLSEPIPTYNLSKNPVTLSNLSDIQRQFLEKLNLLSDTQQLDLLKQADKKIKENADFINFYNSLGGGGKTYPKNDYAAV